MEQLFQDELMMWRLVPSQRLLAFPNYYKQTLTFFAGMGCGRPKLHHAGDFLHLHRKPFIIQRAPQLDAWRVQLATPGVFPLFPDVSCSVRTQGECVGDWLVTFRCGTEALITEARTSNTRAPSSSPQWPRSA
jgi:hypothetical protein